MSLSSFDLGWMLITFEEVHLSTDLGYNSGVHCTIVEDKRNIYNKYGRAGLEQNSSPGPSFSSANFHDFGGAHGFHQFHFRDPMDLFREFFGGTDPFEDLFRESNMNIITFYDNPNYSSKVSM